jgi:hypothetical protein
VDAAGRGDYSREEGTAMVRSKVIATVFGDLLPSPKIERTVKVLMAEDPVAILGGSIALKFMDDEDVHDEIAHSGVAHVRSKNFQVTRQWSCCRGGDARNVMGASREVHVLKEGLQAGKDAIAGPVPVARVFLTSVDVITILIVRSPTARAQAPTATQGCH